ncbi:MAG: helix-turn-helix domain-containing protein [Clostridia bacterium]|nr:helix-turn-helix domain-containing protein [Clostridia bacterium]
MSLFEDLKIGLNQAIDYEKGREKAKVTVLSIQPLESFTAEDIKNIRLATGLTQVLFAKYMGVSPKTVEAWESGRNHPEGTACRLLTMTQKDPSFPEKSGVIVTA